jgi:hypothetical protein
MKPGRLLPVQEREDPRRKVRGALLSEDEFHTRAKTASGKASPARQSALVQAKDPGAPAARANEKRPAAAVGKSTQRQGHDELDVAKRNGRGLRVGADRARSPQAGHRNARQFVVSGRHRRREIPNPRKIFQTPVPFFGASIPHHLVRALPRAPAPSQGPSFSVIVSVIVSVCKKGLFPEVWGCMRDNLRVHPRLARRGANAM